MATTCPRCGTPSDGARFCGYCGAHLGGDRPAGEQGGRDGEAVPRRAAGTGPGVAPPRTASRRGGARGPLASVLAVVATVAALGALALWAGGEDPADDAVDLPDAAAEDGSQDPVDAEDGDPGEPHPEDQVEREAEVTCLGDADCEVWRVGLDGERILGMADLDDRVVLRIQDAGAGEQLVAVTPRGAVDWRHEVRPVDDAGVIAGIVDAGGLVLVLEEDGRITAIEAATGDVRWRAREAEPDTHPLMAERVDGTLLLHLVARTTAAEEVPEMMLLALDEDTGAVRWSRQVGTASITHGVVTTTEDGQLRRLDPTTGEVRWSRPADWLPEDPGDGPTIGVLGQVAHLDASTLVVLDQDDDGAPGATRLLDAEDGTSLATLEGEPTGPVGLPGPQGTGPPLLLTSSTPTGEELTAYDADGEPRWSVPLELDDRCCPSVRVSQDRLVLVGEGRPLPYVLLDPADGRVLREGELDLDGGIQGVLGPGTVLAHEDDHATTVAVDLDTGEPRWRATDAMVIRGQRDGQVLVAGMVGGDLIAVRVE